MSERRQLIRWQVEREAKVKLEGCDESFPCQVKDINPNGLKIFLAQKLTADAEIKLSLVFSDEFTFHLEVWVAWHKAINGYNTYGLYFTRISDTDKQRIQQFVRKDLPEQIQQPHVDNSEKGGEIMQNTNFEDRRVFDRLAAELPVRFLNPIDGQEGEAMTHDVSAKGVGLVSAQELVPTASLELWLEVPDKGEPLYARGEVVWSRQVSQNEYRSGINLEKADFMGVSRIIRTL